jgi:soluble lytic murein transglycosylase-like protein
MHYSDDFGERSGARSASPTYAAVVALLLLTLPTVTFAYSVASFQGKADDILAKTESKYAEMADIAAMLHDYDKNMILAVIVVESEGNPKAVSNRGAQGLMQLMPGTAKAMGATNSKDPLDNILAGTKYLKHLEDVYHFDSQESLVAYNMGPSNAKRWLSQYDAENNSYVKKVMHVRNLLQDREADEAKMRAIAMSDHTQENFLSIAIASVKESAGTLFTKPRTLSMVEVPTGVANNRRATVVTE